MFIRRSKKKNLFGIILLIFTICAILTGCRKEKKGELVLVTEAGFAPYEYYSNGKIVGVDIDIARKIADYLNKELNKWNNSDFSNGVKVHNYVWSKLGGTIGKAKSLNDVNVQKAINLLNN